MMRESSLVPTNLLTSPRLARRLPEEKLICYGVWAAPWMTCVGFGELPLYPFAASLGLSPEATETGIDNLVDAGLFVIDKITGELAVLDWFRFHKFKTPNSQRILRQTIEKIRSKKIKFIILEKSASCFPTAAETASASKNAAEEEKKTTSSQHNFAHPLQGKQFDLHSSGLVCWNLTDQKNADQLATNTPIDELSAAIVAAKAAGKSPVPGTVAKFLRDEARKQKRESNNTKRNEDLQRSDALKEVCSEIEIAHLPQHLRDPMSRILVNNTNGATP